MPFALGPRALAAGYRLIAHEVVSSTNAEAIGHALEGDPGRLWVVAVEQSSGYGRRGRAWHTPNGNLAASLYMPISDGSEQTATIGFAAGLALVSALRSLAPRLAEKTRLKWPNDILVGDGKIAGTLLEAVSPPSGLHGVVIGIGVNTRHKPFGLPYHATSLVDEGEDITSEELFGTLSDAWVEHETLWSSGGGFSALRDRWLRHAAGLGAPMVVRLGKEVLRGTFETVDPEGRLVVRQPDGAARFVSAGDIYFDDVASSWV